MAGTSERSSGGGEVSFNMTPMIDCTFQLILFFILTSQVASQDLPPVELHRPIESVALGAKQLTFPHKMVINIVSAREKGEDADPAFAARAKHYVISGKKIEPREMMRIKMMIEDRLRASGAKKDEFRVEIRADRDLHFSQVVPIMELAGQAGAMKMNITALTERISIK